MTTTVTKNIVSNSVPAWATGVLTQIGHRVTSDTPLKLYEATTGGANTGVTAPTGTGASISDGGITWKYLCTIDYRTVALWAAGLPADIRATTGNDTVQIGAMWKVSNYTGDTQDWVFTGQMLAFGSGAVLTDSTHTVTLTAATGEGFADNVNAQTNALVYNASNGVGLRWTSGIDYSGVMSIQINNFIFSRLQVKIAYTGSNIHCWDFANNSSILDGCIHDLQGGNGGGHNNVYEMPGTTRNCLVVDRNPPNAGSGPIAFCASGIAVNCTFVVPSDATNVGLVQMSAVSYATINAKNCAFFGWGTVINSGHNGIANFTNCATDLANYGTLTLNGVINTTSCLTSKTYANQFVNTTTASGDFRIKNASADLVDHGTTDTTDIPAHNDIVGTDRNLQGTAWDIGAWELIATAAVVDDNPHFIGRLTPVSHSLLRSLHEHYDIGLSTPIQEANPHFVGKFQPVQFNLFRPLRQHEDNSESIIVFIEANPHFIGAFQVPKFNILRALREHQDLSTSAPFVEANPHFISKLTPVIFARLPGLLQHQDTLLTLLPDIPPGFVGRLQPVRFNLLQSLRWHQDNSLSTPITEENPHWIGRFQPVNFNILRSLRNHADTSITSPLKFGSGALVFQKLRLAGTATEAPHNVVPIVDPAMSPYWREKLPLDFLLWLADNFKGLKQFHTLVQFGTGSPIGNLVASPGSIFIRTDGGTNTTLYVKETGTDASGWVAK